MQELPEFNAMAARFKDTPDLVIVGASLDDSGRGNAWQAIEAVERQRPLQFRVLMDPKQASADLFGTYALPETYLISPEGQILRKWVGGQDWDKFLDFRK
jgi:peroxiredoxin